MSKRISIAALEARRVALAAAFIVVTLAAAGCGLDSEGQRAPLDAGVPVADTGPRDAGVRTDAGVDAAIAMDAGTDAGDPTMDAGFDAGDVDAFVPFDAGVPDDAGVDAGFDAAFPMDAGFDAGFDAGPPFMSLDAGMSCPTVGVRSCLGDELIECMFSGPVSLGICPLGCTSIAGTARCLRVRPTHVTDATLLIGGTVPLTPGSGRTLVFDTETGAILDDLGTVIRPAGMAGDSSGILWRRQIQGGSFPDLSIFAMASLTVPSDGGISATGTLALVLLSAGNVTIDGRIDLGGRGAIAGPGGRAGATARMMATGPGGGEPGGIAGITNDVQAGGGGGGHSAAGGAGGDQIVPLYATATGGAGGVVITDVDVSPLVGGGGGGAGASASSGGVGGGGGGAIQISSNGTIAIAATAVITVPGGGGGVGENSGGGGGAGGAIFLEALTITNAGALAANGGGGGGADVTMLSVGTDGERGHDDASFASGGASAGSGAGGGGVGASGATLAGGVGANGSAGAGGGGAAAGRVRFVTRIGGLTLGGVVSPSVAPATSAGTVMGI